MRSIADRPLNWRWLSCVISGSFRRLYDCKSLFCAPACRKNVSAGGRELAPRTIYPVTLHNNTSSFCGRVRILMDFRQSLSLKRILYAKFASSKHPILRGVQHRGGCRLAIFVPSRRNARIDALYHGGEAVSGAGGSRPQTFCGVGGCLRPSFLR